MHVILNTFNYFGKKGEANSPIKLNTSGSI